jgi:hypothetical protein
MERVEGIALTEVLYGLRRRAGTRPSGNRNEYLKALTGSFENAKADSVMARYDEFAIAFVNTELPPWFYATRAMVNLVPLVKNPLTPEQTRKGEDPDVRPVAIGECDMRAIGRTLNSLVQAPLYSRSAGTTAGRSWGQGWHLDSDLWHTAPR